MIIAPFSSGRRAVYNAGPCGCSPPLAEPLSRHDHPTPRTKGFLLPLNPIVPLATRGFVQPRAFAPTFAKPKKMSGVLHYTAHC